MSRYGLKTMLLTAAACASLAGCATPGGDAQQSSVPKASALKVDARLRVAEAAEQSGDRDMALSMYAAAASEAPNDTSIQLRCAEGLARNGKLQDAEALLARRLKSTPRDTTVLDTMGAIQVMSGQLPQAIATLTQVLAQQPDDLKAVVNKAIALDMLHRHEEAQALYRQALTLSPNDVAISNDLALSLMLDGRTEEARQALEPFRDMDGLPERVKINLGIIDAASGHPGEARALLGSRIAQGDLETLTNAINGGAAGRP